MKQLLLAAALAVGLTGDVCAQTTATPTAGTTSGTPNTYTSALLANTGRKGCLIQYTGAGQLRVFIGAPADATATNTIILAPLGMFQCHSGVTGTVITNQISVASATASDTYVLVQQ